MADYTISSEALLQSLLDISSLSIFWKDTHRRFVGANRNFLEFYGFESVEDIIGKTDEDMGWHVDPKPFAEDEWDVIRNGREIYRAPGSCIAHGMIRDIVATKVPIYDKGHIVGLVGFFEDNTVHNLMKHKLQLSSFTDLTTGLLNSLGISEMFRRFAQRYEKANMDFICCTMRIVSEPELASVYGDKFVDSVRARIADVLQQFFGNYSVLGVLDNGDFIIIQQYQAPSEWKMLSHNLTRAINSVYDVDDTPVSLNVHLAQAIYSESNHDTDRMLTLALERLNAQDTPGNALSAEA